MDAIAGAGTSIRSDSAESGVPPAAAPLLLFYPTSPVHVRDLQHVAARLPGWRLQAVLNPGLATVAPGIDAALAAQEMAALRPGADDELDSAMPDDAAILMLGAVFEPFALELMAWAVARGLPVVAVEEVAQLALNQNDINNYDAPFDRLFVASADEFERFVALGYPREMLRVSGLLGYDRLDADAPLAATGILARLGIAGSAKPIVYTTSPLRNRRAIHNKDGRALRVDMLRALAVAARRADRRIVVKLHPNEDPVAEGGAIRTLIPDAIVVGRELAMDELFAATGVLVNRGNSQTCLEAALRGVPTVVAACGLRTLFHDLGGARIVESVNELPDAIAAALEGGPAELSALRAVAFHRPPQGVAAFVAGELATLAAAPPPLAGEARWNWLVRSTLFVGGHARALRLLRRLDAPTAWQRAVGAALEAHLDGRREAAIKHWRACVALDDEWFFPHYELAHGHLAAGDFDAAIAHAEQAIARHPPFHGLWHEIPMHIVAMASLRRLDRLDEAARRLASLQTRSLVEISPELLIEKAMQATARNDPAASAVHCLELACRCLADYPVNASIDGELRRQALDKLHELGPRCEAERSDDAAMHCYQLLAVNRPGDVRIDFALARVGLAQGRLHSASHALVRLAGIPEAPRAIVEWALPADAVAMLMPLWPGPGCDIGKSARLVARTGAWALASCRRTRFADWSNAMATFLLTSVFVLRHWVHRLLGRP